MDATRAIPCQPHNTEYWNWCVSQVIQPFLKELIAETEIAFNITKELEDFTSADSAMIPDKFEELKDLRIEGMNTLALFL